MDVDDAIIMTCVNPPLTIILIKDRKLTTIVVEKKMEFYYT